MGGTQDCTTALENDGSNVKALYRRAQAYEAQAQYAQAFTDLTRLVRQTLRSRFCVDGPPAQQQFMSIAHLQSRMSQLQISQDKAAVEAIRRVKQRMEQETLAKTPIARALQALRDGENISETLRAMVGMCLDDVTHAMDLGRKQGITFLLFFIHERLQREEFDRVRAYFERVFLVV